VLSQYSPNGSEIKLPKATPVPAFRLCCEIENREQRNRKLKPPIPDGDRHRERNSRVFLTAKVIQAPSQPNTKRKKFISPSVNIVKVILRNNLDLNHQRNRTQSNIELPMFNVLTSTVLERKFHGALGRRLPPPTPLYIRDV